MPGVLYFAGCNGSEASSTHQSPQKSCSSNDLSQPSSPVKQFGAVIFRSVTSLTDLAAKLFGKS